MSETDDTQAGGTAAQSSKHTGKVIGIAIAAALGGLLFGFDSAVINGAVDSIQDTFKLGSAAVGITVSITLIGCAIGAWFAGQLADVWGRKAVMVIGAGLFVVTSIGSGLSFSDVELMIWRLLGGLAIGIASVVAPAYIGEIAPAKLRGGLASLQQLAITVGIFLALLSDTALAGSDGDALRQLWFGLEAWRWMLLVGVVPALVYGFLSISIPESPQFLIRKGRIDEASTIVRDVTGAIDVGQRIGEIEESLANAKKVRYRDLRGSVLGLHPMLWVGIIMAGLQQVVGINAIFYYSTTLWKSVGFSSSDSFVTSVITSVINVALTFVAILWVDKVGRRALLLWGSVGMFVGLLMASASFFNAQTVHGELTLPSPWGVIALFGANIFVIFFAATWGPVLWVVLGEIFPNNIRSLGLGIGAASNWVFNFLVTLLFPILSAAIGLGWVYAGFAFFAVVSFFFVMRALPDVTGLELEDKNKTQHLHHTQRTTA